MLLNGGMMGVSMQSFNYSNSIYGGYIYRLYRRQLNTNVCGDRIGLCHVCSMHLCTCMNLSAVLPKTICMFHNFALSCRNRRCLLTPGKHFIYSCAYINGSIIVKATVVMSIINRATDEEKKTNQWFRHRATPATV